MNAVYFLAGVLATLIGLVLAGLPEKKAPLKKRWASVSSFTWTFNFPIRQEGKITGMQLAEAISIAMVSSMRRPGAKELSGIIIDDGNYDVKLSVHASLIQREE